MKFTELKKEYVIQTLGQGNTVIACDFSTLKMSNCDDMTVGAINALIAKAETVFFKGVANE